MNGRGQRSWSSPRTQRSPLWFVDKYIMPLCPRLYPGRTSICSRPSPSVINRPGLLWLGQSDRYTMMRVKAESQALWLQGQARPGMTQAQGNREHCGLPWPRPWGPHQPLLCLWALPASVILPANPIPDQRPRRKKGKRRERRQRSEKGEEDWRVCWGEKGENNKPLFIWQGRQLLRPGHLCACCLPGWRQAPPKCPPVPDPWKVAVATPPAHSLK